MIRPVGFPQLGPLWVRPLAGGEVRQRGRSAQINLRFDCNPWDDAECEACLEDVAERSVGVCDTCGEAGIEMMIDGWIVTRCDVHSTDMSGSDEPRFPGREVATELRAGATMGDREWASIRRHRTGGNACVPAKFASQPAARSNTSTHLRGMNQIIAKPWVTSRSACPLHKSHAHEHPFRVAAFRLKVVHAAFGFVLALFRLRQFPKLA